MIAWPWRRRRPEDGPARAPVEASSDPPVAHAMVVAGERATRERLQSHLAGVARQVSALRSSAAAIRRLRRERPDIALVEWELLEASPELLAAMNGGGGERPVGVAAVVEAGRDESLRRAAQADVDDLVLLPSSPAEIRARVLRLSSRRTSEHTGAHHRFQDRDSLTGLATRDALLARLARSCGRARKLRDRKVAVLFLDVDRFQQINESLGHGRGDQLLRAMAERVETICRPTDMVARFGGDEFVVLLEDVPDLRAVTAAAERIQQQARLPFDLDGEEVFTTVSIGIAVWGEQHRAADELIRDADTAKARAKTMGRDRFAVFDAAMHAEVVEALALENDLRRAVGRSEFCAAFQPITALADGRIVGFEALARWRHPERGILRPGVFIAAAEEMGLVIQLDRSLAEEACTQLRSWRSRFKQHGGLTVSVNISSTQFLQADLVPRIDHILRKTGLYGGSLVLEVTESVLMENARHAAEMLQQLRALDIRLSIDDFGTGYSSLAYLRRFDVDTLKIDRSFVARAADDEESREIVRTIANLAAALGKHTVAEGVETRAQLEAMRELGVTHVQGNLVCPPVDHDAATALLELTASADDHLEAIFAARRRGDPAAAITGFGSEVAGQR